MRLNARTTSAPSPRLDSSVPWNRSPPSTSNTPPPSAARAARTFATKPATSGSRSSAPCRSLVPMIVSVLAAPDGGGGLTGSGPGPCEHAMNRTSESRFTGATILRLVVGGRVLERARLLLELLRALRRHRFGTRGRGGAVDLELDVDGIVLAELDERAATSRQR